MLQIERPNFTCLMSVYKKTVLSELIDCFDSIEDQTLRPSEIIIVLDGPLNKNVQYYLNHGISEGIKNISKFVILNENKGLGIALNEGLNASTNEFVIRVDTDDINHPKRFETQVEFFDKNPDISVSSTTVVEFEQNINIPISYKRLPLSVNQVKHYAKFRNPVNHPASILRKKDIQAVGGFKHMPFFEDYYLWLRLLFNGYKIKNIDEELVFMRINNDFFSRRINWETTKSHFNLYLFMIRNGFYNPVFLIFIFLSKELVKILPKPIIKKVFLTFFRSKK